MGQEVTEIQRRNTWGRLVGREIKRKGKMRKRSRRKVCRTVGRERSMLPVG